MSASAHGVWCVIAGGGTAGHVLPALAVARELTARAPDVVPTSVVHLVGSTRGIENELVPRAGLDLTALPGRGLVRRLSPQNITAGVGLLRAAGRAVGLLRRLDPAVVLAVGGYASVACGLAAAGLRIPLVVAEQNAVPGAANRLTARFAAAAAVSYPGTALPRAVVTGNPVRPEVLELDPGRDRQRLRDELGIRPGERLALVVGGSLGARRLNEAVAEAAARSWPGVEDLAVHHVVGERDWNDDDVPVADEQWSSPVDGVRYRPVRFENDLPRIMAAADLVVSRAGATTVSELAVLGVPAVLVPLPGAPGDHQTANATALADSGAALVVADDQLTGGRLCEEIARLLADEALRVRMAEAARRAAHPDAAARVADLVAAHARRPLP